MIVDDLARGTPIGVGADTATSPGGESVGKSEVPKAVAISSSVVITIASSISQYDASSRDDNEGDVAAVAVGSPSPPRVSVAVEVEDEEVEGVSVVAVETTETETSSTSTTAPASASESMGRTSTCFAFPFALASIPTMAKVGSLWPVLDASASDAGAEKAGTAARCWSCA